MDSRLGARQRRTFSIFDRLGGRNDGGAGIESRREWGLGPETAESEGVG